MSVPLLRRRAGAGVVADDQRDEERFEDVGVGLLPEQFRQQLTPERGTRGVARRRHEGRQRGTDGGRPRAERRADQRADLRVGPAPRQAAFGVRRDVARRVGARPEQRRRELRRGGGHGGRRLLGKHPEHVARLAAGGGEAAPVGVQDGARVAGQGGAQGGGGQLRVLGGGEPRGRLLDVPPAADRVADEQGQRPAVQRGVGGAGEQRRGGDPKQFAVGLGRRVRGGPEAVGDGGDAACGARVDGPAGHTAADSARVLLGEGGEQFVGTLMPVGDQGVDEGVRVALAVRVQQGLGGRGDGRRGQGKQPPVVAEPGAQQWLRGPGVGPQELTGGSQEPVVAARAVRHHEPPQQIGPLLSGQRERRPEPRPEVLGHPRSRARSTIHPASTRSTPRYGVQSGSRSSVSPSSRTAHHGASAGRGSRAGPAPSVRRGAAARARGVAAFSQVTRPVRGGAEEPAADGAEGSVTGSAVGRDAAVPLRPPRGPGDSAPSVAPRPPDGTGPSARLPAPASAPPTTPSTTRVARSRSGDPCWRGTHASGSAEASPAVRNSSAASIRPASRMGQFVRTPVPGEVQQSLDHGPDAVPGNGQRPGDGRHSSGHRVTPPVRGGPRGRIPLVRRPVRRRAPRPVPDVQPGLHRGRARLGRVRPAVPRAPRRFLRTIAAPPNRTVA